MDSRYAWALFGNRRSSVLGGAGGGSSTASFGGNGGKGGFGSGGGGGAAGLTGDRAIVTGKNLVKIL